TFACPAGTGARRGANCQERSRADGSGGRRGDALTMSQAQAAAAVERLPWLTDEPKPTPPAKAQRRGNGREVAGWGVAAILLVAGASYWMGAHSWEQTFRKSE